MESILYQRIEELCAGKGITMSKLASDLGFSPSLIRKWKGETSPSIDKVKLIAEYFGVSLDYLIGMSEIPSPAEKLMADEDIISLQRARSKMSDQDKDKMMKMIRLGFDYAFSDNNGDSDD